MTLPFDCFQYFYNEVIDCRITDCFATCLNKTDSLLWKVAFRLEELQQTQAHRVNVGFVGGQCTYEESRIEALACKFLFKFKRRFLKMPTSTSASGNSRLICR